MPSSLLENARADLEDIRRRAPHQKLLLLPVPLAYRLFPHAGVAAKRVGPR